MPKLDRDEIFDETPQSNYLWCLHCERAYKRGEFRKVKGLQMCPYDGCDGDTVLDAWDWATIRDANGYPEVPEPGVTYPQYGHK